MHNVLLSAIHEEFVRSRIFQAVTPERGVRFINFLKHNSVDDIRGEFDWWNVSYDSEKQVFTLQLQRDGKVAALLTMDSKGIWRGRSRVSNGTLVLTSTVRGEHWKILGSPVKFYATIEVDPDEPTFRYEDHLPPQLDWSEVGLNLRKPPYWNHIREFPKSDTAIALVGHDRPTYFERVVKSLAANKGVIEGIPVYVFLDACDPDVMREQENLAKAILPVVLVVKRPVNFGCGRNLIDARRQVFDLLGYRQAFICEDDLVLSETYLSTCLQLYRWATETYSDVGAVQAWNFCTLPLDAKREAHSLVKATWTNWWGYLMGHETWRRIRAFLYKFERLFLGGVYARRPHRSVKKWFQLKYSSERDPIGVSDHYPVDSEFYTRREAYLNGPPTGQDAATSYAMDLAGYVRLCTLVNHGEYIGQQGIHMNPKWFTREGFGNIRLDELGTPKQFVPLKEGQSFERLDSAIKGGLEFK